MYSVLGANADKMPPRPERKPPIITIVLALYLLLNAVARGPVRDNYNKIADVRVLLIKTADIIVFY